MQDGGMSRRNLPQVQKLLEMPASDALCEKYGRAAVIAVVRDHLAGLRERIAAGVLAEIPGLEAMLEDAGAKLAARRLSQVKARSA